MPRPDNPHRPPKNERGKTLAGRAPRERPEKPDKAEHKKRETTTHRMRRVDVRPPAR